MGTSRRRLMMGTAITASRVYDYSTLVVDEDSIPVIPASGEAVDLTFDITIQYSQGSATGTYTGTIKTGDTLPDSNDVIWIYAFCADGTVWANGEEGTIESTSWETMSCDSRGTTLGLEQEISGSFIFEIYIGNTSVYSSIVSIFQAANTIESCTGISFGRQLLFIAVGSSDISAAVYPLNPVVAGAVYSSGSTASSVTVTYSTCFIMGFITGATITESWQSFPSLYSNSACTQWLTTVSASQPLATLPYVYFGIASSDSRSISVMFTYTIGGLSANVTLSGSRIATANPTLASQAYVSGFPTSTADRSSGSTTFYVKWYNKAWTLSSDSSWCTVSPTSGGGTGFTNNTLQSTAITMTRTTNSTLANRKATITLKSGGTTISTHTYTQTHLATIDPDIPVVRD